MATAMKSVIIAAVFAFYCLPVAHLEIPPRYKLCVDNKCNSPISQVRALDNYEHKDPAFISFKKDKVITIYGKEDTDSPQGLWFGESSDEPGKRGFFAPSVVREEIVFNKDPSIKVRIHIQETEAEPVQPVGQESNQTPEAKQDTLAEQADQESQAATVGSQAADHQPEETKDPVKNEQPHEKSINHEGLYEQNIGTDGSRSEEVNSEEGQYLEQGTEQKEANLDVMDEIVDAEASLQVEVESGTVKQELKTRAEEIMEIEDGDNLGEPQEQDGSISNDAKIVEGTSDNRETDEAAQDGQQEANPDIEVIDGTTIHLSDLLPTPASEDVQVQITPTPTPLSSERAPVDAPEPDAVPQGMDLNPTRSTGQATPVRKRNDEWELVQQQKGSLNHLDIEDHHSKLVEEAQIFLKTRNSENISPQLGKAVRDLMKKGVLEGNLKEDKPIYKVGSTEPKDSLQPKDKVATGTAEIVLPSGPDLDQEKIRNFFNQLLTLPQFRNQPEKALDELNKYLDTPHTRVGLTKNEYQVRKVQQQKESDLIKGTDEEQRAEDQSRRETDTQRLDLEDNDPKKLLRDEQQNQDDTVGNEAYLQAQAEEMRRKRELEMKKGDEGDASQDVRQEDVKDIYAAPSDGIQEDERQNVDPARLLRESEQREEQNDVQVGDVQPQENQSDNNGHIQDAKKDEESDAQTDEGVQKVLTPANNNEDDNADPNSIGEPVLAGSTAPSPDDLGKGAVSPSDSKPSDSEDVDLEQKDVPEPNEEVSDHPVDHNEVGNTQLEANENEKVLSHQDPIVNLQQNDGTDLPTSEQILDVLTSPNNNQHDSEQKVPELQPLLNVLEPDKLSSQEHFRSEEVHQEIEELFANLDLIDVPSGTNQESNSDSEEPSTEPPEASGPPATHDPYLEELHRLESTIHPPAELDDTFEDAYKELDDTFEDMYKDEQKAAAPPDAGIIFEGGSSEIHPEMKVDETPDPYLKEIQEIESTTPPPVASHVEDKIIQAEKQPSNTPSDAGRIFEGGNSDIDSDVEIEVEDEQEDDVELPNRFNRRQVPLGLDEGSAFGDPGLSTMNDTYDEDNWINMMKPALLAINNSLQPLMQMLPDDVQLALHGADFLGIPWPIVIIIELVSCAVFSFLLCVCMCSCRNPKAFNSSMLDEIEALHGQKADILDTLDMTTSQFKVQNQHYYELKRNADKNKKEKTKLSQSCKELKVRIQSLEQDLSSIRSTSGQQENQLTASQQQVDLYEEQVSTASQTIVALQQQVKDLEFNLLECASSIAALKQENQSLSEQNQVLASTKDQLTEEITGWNERVLEMNEQVELLHNEKKDLDESVTYKDNEIEVLKDCLLQLKGLSADDDEAENDKEAKVQQLMDVTRVSTKLTLVEGEKTDLEEKYETEVKGRRELEAKVGAQQQEVDIAKADYKKAKSSLDEAQTKLDVMTEYFKNKEVDLQRKLGREEALRLHSDSKLDSADEKAATAEVEVSNYRTQIKDLKEELVKAERNYRNQVAAHEKKAHDSWMSVRTAERELQEAKREATNLRHRLTELEGRRAKSEAAPLYKPSPSGRAPSRNSILADTPSPPHLDQGRALSPGRPMYPGDHPPSPPHMRHDMDYPPMGRLPPPGRHSRGPPMHDMDYDPRDMREFSPDGPPPDFGFDPHGPPPPNMDFGPHGPQFNGPPPPMRHPFPPRDFPPHPDDFDHRGPLPDDRDFGPPMGDREFGPPRGYVPPPPGMDFGPIGAPPPPGGPMHGPGPYQGDMGPPPMDRRDPPPPLGRSGPSPGPRNPSIRPNMRGPFSPPTGPSPSGTFPPTGTMFGTPTGTPRRTSTPLEGTPVTPHTRPSSRPVQGP